MKTKMLTITLAALLLISCSSQENGENAKQADGTNKVPISQIWNGYEELQGKQYGNAFTLPEKIEPVNVERLYSFVPKDNPKWEKVKSTAKPFMKAFYGESFKDDNMTETSNSAGEKRIEYSSREGDYCLVTGSGPLAGNKAGFEPLSATSIIEVTDRYDPSQRDVSLELDIGTCTVGELCDNAKSFCDRTFRPLFSDYEFEPAKVTVCLTNEMKNHAMVICGMRYKGLLMEPFFSQLNQVEDRGKYQVYTYYSPNYIELDMNGADSVYAFNNQAIPSQNKEKELTEIISFKSAVGLLENNLAVNSDYKIEKVSLMYCQKFTYPGLSSDEKTNSDILADYGEIPDQPYVPTWCFSWESTVNNSYAVFYVKVNAVTGEITIDI